MVKYYCDRCKKECKDLVTIQIKRAYRFKGGEMKMVDEEFCLKCEESLICNYRDWLHDDK